MWTPAVCHTPFRPVNQGTESLYFVCSRSRTHATRPPRCCICPYCLGQGTSRGQHRIAADFVLQSIFEVLDHKYHHLWCGGIWKRPAQIEHFGRRSEYAAFPASSTRSDNQKRIVVSYTVTIVLDKGNVVAKTTLQICSASSHPTVSSLVQTHFGPG